MSAQIGMMKRSGSNPKKCRSLDLFPLGSSLRTPLRRLFFTLIGLCIVLLQQKNVS